jgi:hypothetical protein
MYLLGAVTMSVFGLIYFGLLNTGSLLLIFIAIVLSFIPHDMMYGPQAALIAESFTGRVRYSGASLGYQFASVIAAVPRRLLRPIFMRGSSRHLRLPRTLRSAPCSRSLPPL